MMLWVLGNPPAPDNFSPEPLLLNCRLDGKAYNSSIDSTGADLNLRRGKTAFLNVSPTQSYLK